MISFSYLPRPCPFAVAENNGKAKADIELVWVDYVPAATSIGGTCQPKAPIMGPPFIRWLFTSTVCSSRISAGETPKGVKPGKRIWGRNKSGRFPLYYPGPGPGGTRKTP